MKRVLLVAIGVALVLSAAACLPRPGATPTNVFVPLDGTTVAGSAQTRVPGQGQGQGQGQKILITPGPDGLPPAAQTARAGGAGPTGVAGAVETARAVQGQPSGTPAAGPIFVVPEATRTPAPTPTSVAARFFWTPTPRPTTAPPTPRPSLQGKLVYQTSSGGDINVVNPDGSGLRTIARGLDPAWSPDGKQIAFTKWVDGPGLYVINADGTGERRLYDLNNAKSPAWSADGSMIVVTKRDSRLRSFGFGNRTFTTEQSTWMLFAIPVAGGDPVPVPVDGEYYAFDPTWSPRGPIVYRGARGLYITSFEPEAQAKVLGNTPRPDSPAWSPDGSKLAFMMWQNDHWDVFTMDPDGTGVHILTPPAPFLTRVPNNVAPAWSPDGKHIVFLSDREGLDQWRVYAMEADGSDQHKIMDVPVVYEANSERVLSWTR